MCGPRSRSICIGLLLLLVLCWGPLQADVVFSDEQVAAINRQIDQMESEIVLLGNLLHEEKSEHDGTRSLLADQINETETALTLYDEERTLRMRRETSLRVAGVFLVVETVALTVLTLVVALR